MPGFNIPLPNSCHDVNAFTDSSAFDGPNHLIESARAHRYCLRVFSQSGQGSSNIHPFGTLSDGILLYLSKCSRPSIEIDEITIHNAQDEIYRPGKNRWNTIDFTFYEVLYDKEPTTNEHVTDQTAYRIFTWWAFRVINIQSSCIGSPAEYAADAQLDMLDGVGREIWTYQLYRCWPTKITPSELDYASSEISTISATLRYDKALEY